MGYNDNIRFPATYSLAICIALDSVRGSVVSCKRNVIIHECDSNDEALKFIGNYTSFGLYCNLRVSYKSDNVGTFTNSTTWR